MKANRDIPAPVRGAPATAAAVPAASQGIRFAVLLAAAALFPLRTAEAARVASAPGAFAPIALGGRGTALAGAQTASPSEAEAIVYNPAALAAVKDWAGGYYYGDMYGLIPYHFTSAAYRLKGKPFAAGAAWIQNGDEIYSENEVVLAGAYERGWIRLGGAYKVRFAGTGKGGSSFRDPETNLDHQVDGTALGLLGFDLGAIVRPFGPKYAVAVAVKDLASRISWETSNEAGTARGEYAEYVPVSLRYGFLFDPDPFLDLAVDYEPALYHDGRSRLATGVELVPLELLPDSWAKPYLHDALAARIGYARNMFTNEASHRFSVGLGLGCRYQGLRLAVDAGYEWNFNFEDANNLRVGFALTR